MFDVGWQELLLILAVALLVFGPERMVDLARTAGKALREFRKITSDLSSGLTDVLKEEAPKRATPATEKPAETAPAPIASQPPIFESPLVIPPPAPVPPDEYDSADLTIPPFPEEVTPAAAGEPPADAPNPPLG